MQCEIRGHLETNETNSTQHYKKPLWLLFVLADFFSEGNKSIFLSLPETSFAALNHNCVTECFIEA